MDISFLGATSTVTGSKYLLESEGKKILIDCGLFQGYKDLRLKNWETLPVAPNSIDAVILTHAHIDHSGYLPLLVKNGFTGPIYATEGTYDLCRILLPDSGHIHEEDAKRANKYGYTKHHPALPLYTQADAEKALKQFKTVNYGQIYSIFKNIAISWYRAGHIIGSAIVQCQIEDKKITFTGDMGRPHDPFMKPPAIIQQTDYLITESTYGDRLHDSANPADRIAEVVNNTIKKKGTLLIPAFAVGRTQHMLYYLGKLIEEERIPQLPIYLDSPMAINATELMIKHHGEHRLTEKQCQKVGNVAKYINTPEESKFLDLDEQPKIIISASGMMSGGRILHHLKAYAPNPKNTILITGFQAGGTRGARLLNGERELKIHGQMIPIRAGVHYLTNTSAHADYEELINWLKEFHRPPYKTFITHGETQAAISLKDKIESKLNWTCRIPEFQEKDHL